MPSEMEQVTDTGQVSVPPLDGKGPMWLQIRRSLALAIMSGKWPAGTKVPAELTLTDHYVASRMTVNKALQSLVAQGLIARRRKIGTVVVGRARERPVMEIWDPADDVRREGHKYSCKLVDGGMLGSQSAYRDDLPVGPGTPILCILCLHCSDNQPFQLEERLINAEAAPNITSQPLEAVSPGQWLLANAPWTEARHAISARGAPLHVARHLALKEGSACLVVERRTWNEAIPITFARLWYPGTGHALEGQFRPS